MGEDRYMEIDRENRILLQKMSDLIRITQENQAILRRVQTAAPVYNHLQWEESHRRNELYLRNACEFPVVLRQQSGPTLGRSQRIPGGTMEKEKDKLDELLEAEERKAEEAEAKEEEDLA